METELLYCRHPHGMEVPTVAKKEAPLSKAVLFFFGAWLFAKYLDSLHKKQEFAIYKCWNCDYTLRQEGISPCPNCGASLYWGNPTSDKSPKKVRPAISPMISFLVFVSTLIILLVCVFIEVKTPSALEGTKLICYSSFGYSCGKR